LKTITTIDRIEKSSSGSPGFGSFGSDSTWQSNFKYQEENIIPEGLRISQIGGGSHAVVQKKSVLALKHENNAAKKFKIRRFTNFSEINRETFFEAISELEEKNMPKLAVKVDESAALEQSDLIMTVLGKENEEEAQEKSSQADSGRSSVSAPESETLEQDPIEPLDAQELYDDAQRPDSSSSTVVIAAPSTKTVKRLKNYKKEIEQFKVDLNALKDRDVPKYFDSDLGLSWLQTKMVLDSLAGILPAGENAEERSESPEVIDFKKTVEVEEVRPVRSKVSFNF